MNHFSSRGLEILTQYLSLLRRSARSSRFYLASLVPQSASFRHSFKSGHKLTLRVFYNSVVRLVQVLFLRSGLGTAHAALILCSTLVGCRLALPCLGCAWLACAAALPWPFLRPSCALRLLLGITIPCSP